MQSVQKERWCWSKMKNIRARLESCGGSGRDHGGDRANTSRNLSRAFHCPNHVACAFHPQRTARVNNILSCGEEAMVAQRSGISQLLRKFQVEDQVCLMPSFSFFSGWPAAFLMAEVWNELAWVDQATCWRVSFHKAVGFVFDVTKNREPFLESGEVWHDRGGVLGRRTCHFH